MNKKQILNARSQARQLALQAVYQREVTGDNAETVIFQFESAEAAEKADLEYFRLLVRASEQYSEQVEKLLTPYLSYPFARVDPVDRSALRNAVYEILYVEEMDAVVSISEAVRLSKRFGSSGGFRFVNAVLDAFVKRRGQEHSFPMESSPRPSTFPASETALIGKYFKTQNNASVILGSGDDAALLKFGNQRLVATTDTLVAGTHFLLGESPRALGHKSLAVNLSDLAAMGAQPLWLLLTLSTSGQNEDWFAEFSEGFLALAKEFDTELVGGDLVSGPLSVTVCALGKASKDFMPRTGAQVGDAIFVTGTVGGATLALREPKIMETLHPELRRDCSDRLHFPTPRVREGMKISRYATAATDVSDGLLLNLKHILEASKVGAVIELDDIPFHRAWHDYLDEPQERLGILAGGEDYELLCTIPEGSVKKFEKALDTEGMQATKIGVITDSETLECQFAGEVCALPKKLGHDQFSSGG